MSVRLSPQAAPPRGKAHAAQPSAATRRVARLVAPEFRHDIIAQAAYFRAEQRGFEPGHELEDWLAAEAEVDAALAIGLPSPAG